MGRLLFCRSLAHFCILKKPQGNPGHALILRHIFSLGKTPQFTDAWKKEPDLKLAGTTAGYITLLVRLLLGFKSPPTCQYVPSENRNSSFLLWPLNLSINAITFAPWCKHHHAKLSQSTFTSHFHRNKHLRISRLLIEKVSCQTWVSFYKGFNQGCHQTVVFSVCLDILSLRHKISSHDSTFVRFYLLQLHHVKLLRKRGIGRASKLTSSSQRPVYKSTTFKGKKKNNHDTEIYFQRVQLTI